MCYVHVTALVAEYLTRKGKDVPEPGREGVREGRVALHTLLAFCPWLQQSVAPTGKAKAPVSWRGRHIVLASYCSAKTS